MSMGSRRGEVLRSGVVLGPGRGIGCGVIATVVVTAGVVLLKVGHGSCPCWFRFSVVRAFNALLAAP